jgi:hypothetical protein
MRGLHASTKLGNSLDERIGLTRNTLILCAMANQGVPLNLNAPSSPGLQTLSLKIDTNPDTSGDLVVTKICYHKGDQLERVPIESYRIKYLDEYNLVIPLPSSVENWASKVYDTVISQVIGVWYLIGGSADGLSLVGAMCHSSNLSRINGVDVSAKELTVENLLGMDIAMQEAVIEHDVDMIYHEGQILVQVESTIHVNDPARMGNLAEGFIASLKGA